MQGTVKTLIDVHPSNSIIFRGLAEQQTEKVIELVGTSQPFHIEKVESSLDDKITQKLETVEDGKHYQLKVSNAVKQGNYNGFIKITTDLPQKPEIVIRVSASIEGDIAVKPQTILVGKLAAQQPPRQGKIMVISNRNKPFQITKLTYDEHLLKVTQEPLPKEPGYALEITPLMENVAAGSRQQTTVTIETDATPDVKYDVQVHIINAGDSAPAAGGANKPSAKSPSAKPGPEGNKQSEKKQ